MDRPLRYRDLRSILAQYGVQELETSRGKGSERIFFGMVEGRRVIHTIRCHKESEVKYIPVVKAARRVFRLTAQDGVSDREFYGR